MEAGAGEARGRCHLQHAGGRVQGLEVGEGGGVVGEVGERGSVVWESGEWGGVVGECCKGRGVCREDC